MTRAGSRVTCCPSVIFVITRPRADTTEMTHRLKPFHHSFYRPRARDGRWYASRSRRCRSSPETGDTGNRIWAVSSVRHLRDMLSPGGSDRTDDVTAATGAWWALIWCSLPREGGDGPRTLAGTVMVRQWPQRWSGSNSFPVAPFGGRPRLTELGVLIGVEVAVGVAGDGVLPR